MRQIVGKLFWLLGLLGCAATLAGDGRPIVVTVDDLPLSGIHASAKERERITREMLAVLAKHEIPAVGMVTWGNVRSTADRALLEQWIAAGHELGNHGYEHLDYTRTDPQTFIQDVERARTELAQLLSPHGKSIRFFRFPMLHEGETAEKRTAIRSYLELTSQRNLPVTIDNWDFSFERPWVDARRGGEAELLDEIAEDYLASMRIFTRHHERTGDELFGRALPQILLLHAGDVGAAQWDRLFTWLERTGHRFATVDEVLADEAFAEEPPYVGRTGFGLWDRWGMKLREEQTVAEIRRLLDARTTAWNSGDLQRYCSFYDEQALLLVPSGPARGRQWILDRYLERFDDRNSMGLLSFEVLEIRPITGTETSILGDSRPADIHGASVAAQWKIEYLDREDAGGLTLLTIDRRADRWIIVQDSAFSSRGRPLGPATPPW